MGLGRSTRAMGYEPRATSKMGSSINGYVETKNENH